MDQELLFKWLALLGASGVAVLIVYCATALPGMASGENATPGKTFLIIAVMALVVVALIVAAFFVAKNVFQ